MSLTRTGRNDSPLGNPVVRPYDLAVSQSINPGDWTVLTNAASHIRVRKLTSTDISAHFEVSSNIAGVLGIAMFSAYTDANGYAIVNAAPANVAGGAFPLLPLPTYASSLWTDPVNALPFLEVAVSLGGASFIMRAQTTSNAAVTVGPDTITHTTGIQTYNTTDFAWNFGATSTDICGFISGLLQQDPNYNVSSTQCLVEGKILNAYNQYTTGYFYAS